MGNKYKKFEYINFDNGINFNEKLQSVLNLAKKIQSKIILETFNYLKINVIPQHIELSFISSIFYFFLVQILNHLFRLRFKIYILKEFF